MVLAIGIIVKVNNCPSEIARFSSPILGFCQPPISLEAMSTPIHNLVRSLTCKVFVCVVAELLLLSIASDSQAQSQCKKCTSPPKVDWTTRASHYTHDPYGNRVDQYAQAVAPPSFERPDFQRSGYRHYRSTIQAGNSADNLARRRGMGQSSSPLRRMAIPIPTLLGTLWPLGTSTTSRWNLASQSRSVRSKRRQLPQRTFWIS